MILRNHMHLMYFISETHYFSNEQSLLVINLIGPLSSQNISTFEQCLEQVSHSKAKWIIVNFRDISSHIDPTFLFSLNQLKSIVQKRAGLLRFVGLHPQIKQLFLTKKLVLQEEVADNLARALESFPIKQAA